MKTETNRPANGLQTELISIYQEHSKEILKIMRDFVVGYRHIGIDQSQRIIYEITYDEKQLSNISTIRKGILELERTNHFTDLILTGIRRLLS